MWCYKTTKENLDRVDRKFTQLIVDEKILKTLKKTSRGSSTSHLKFKNLIQEFEHYVARKSEDARKGKFATRDNKELRGEYVFLCRRFKAVEDAARFFLGKKELKEMADLYEAEMIRRILESREEK